MLYNCTYIFLEGVLYDTALAEEIKVYFPLTISMVEYGGREYYAALIPIRKIWREVRGILRMVKLLTARRIIIWPFSMHRPTPRIFR